MNSMGLWMLLSLGVLIVTTGIPVWALLVGTASAFAAAGVASSLFEWHVLQALPSRIVGLLELDLLQALPLYVFVGVMLQRLTLADTVFSTLSAWGGRTAAANAMAALGLGALIAPMNGSVASSSALVSRLVAPRLGQLHAPKAIALVSAAATIGVVVPPSLVLILLGDAMLRAHTEASNLPGYRQMGSRIINTQDVLHAALLPAALVLLLWLVVAWWQSRCEPSEVGVRRLRWTDYAVTLLCILSVLVLLGSVFTGQLLAVEAAASAGCILVLLALSGRRLSADQWMGALMDTLSLSGALMALLVGATTFSLVFRAFGTDQWLSSAVLSSALSTQSTALVVLVFVALCAWVLDAFEMIFVVIPIIGPALINRLGDAQQASVLLLLVLQLSFLIPPMGYAVVMARTRSGLEHCSSAAVLRAVLPFAAVQCAVIAAVFLWPATVHLLDPPTPVETTDPAPSDAEIVRQMEEMSRQGLPPTGGDAAR